MHICVRINIGQVKRTLTYSLFLLLMFAFSYKTISYCFSISDSSICFFQELDCEEKEAESKEADENEKKIDILEYLSFNNLHELTVQDQLSYSNHSKLLFFTSDYSLGVYSPPEQTTI